MKCPICGYELTDDVIICPNCGAELKGDSIDEAAETPETDTAAAEAEEYTAAEAADDEPVVSGLPGDDGGSIPPAKPKKKWWILVLVLLVAAAAAAAAGYVSYRNYYNEHYLVHEIQMDQDLLEMIAGDTAQLTWIVLPETAKDQSVTFTSSDTGVASVSESGFVTAAGSGQCVITVTTVNDFSDSCEVYVKDYVDLQKDAVDAVAGYIKNNNPITATNPSDNSEVSVVKIRDIDDEYSFALGTLGEDLVLCYRDAVSVDSVDVDVDYTTYLNINYGDLEKAEVVQENQVEIYGFPVRTTLKSVISLADYQRGAVVPIESIQSDIEGMTVTPEMQKAFNNGVKGCFEEFRSFLEYHPELNSDIGIFGFTAKGDAPVIEEEPVSEGVDSFAESMAESMPEYAESGTTIVEEVVDPESLDSTVSSVENAGIIAAPVIGGIESSVEEVQNLYGIESVAEEAPEVSLMENSAIESAAVAVEEIIAPLAEAESAIEEIPEETAAAAAVIVGEAESGIENIAEQAGIAAAAAAAAVDSAAEEIVGEAAEAAESLAEGIAGEAAGIAAAAGAAAAEAADAAEDIISDVESGAESVVESMVEDIMELQDSLEAEAEKTASGYDEQFKAITDSLAGTISTAPFVPSAIVKVMC